MTWRSITLPFQSKKLTKCFTDDDPMDMQHEEPLIDEDTQLQDFDEDAKLQALDILDDCFALIRRLYSADYIPFILARLAASLLGHIRKTVE